LTDAPPYFDSDLHAFIAGAIWSGLDFSRLAAVRSPGHPIEVVPQVDGEGNFLPEWTIEVLDPKTGGRAALFRLALTQEVPKVDDAGPED
jgi:hypothetical protein